MAPTVTALLKRLDTTPTFVAGPANHVLAWNDAWELLVRPLGMLDGAVPNLARHVFLHPVARTVYPDWVAAADEQVSRGRAATARWGDDDGFAALMDELRSAPGFTERWSCLPLPPLVVVEPGFALCRTAAPPRSQLAPGSGCRSRNLENRRLPQGRVGVCGSERPLARAQENFDLGRLRRAPQEVPLRLLAAVTDQELQLVDSLHALGDDL